MRRLLGLILALLIVALLVYAAVFFADHPGSVTIVWEGWRADPTVGELVMAIAALFVAGALALWILRGLVRAPGAFFRARRERRRREGYKALTQGMVAVAAGEADEARRLARKADVLLAEPPLTLLLQAQAAQLNGDEQAARRYFTAMLEAPETEFLGLRGLLTQALKAGNEAEALSLAERARTLRPKTGWALASLTELQSRAGLWKEAETTLSEAVRRKALPAPEGKRAQAALLLEQSRAAATSGDGRSALALAERAEHADPGFAPTAAWHAGLLRDAGRVRQAARTVEQAWRLAPQPALLDVYASLAPDETPLARMKRVQQLVETNPDHLESHLALAEVALHARLWGEARRHLARLGASDDVGASAALPPARASRLLAEVEEAERQDSARARFWLSCAAAAAALEPTYVCAKCGTEAAHWVSVCPRCRAFASFDWRAPAHATRERLALMPPLPLPPPAPAPPAAGADAVSIAPPPRLTAANTGR